MSSSKGLGLAHEAASLAERAAVLADRILVEDAVDRVSGEALQSLMAAAVKLYVARLEAGPGLPPFAEGDVTATEVAVAATGMLKAVEMEVFELGMWQVWGNS
jgi:hypothetical protein